jgi:hypothetical protein
VMTMISSPSATPSRARAYPDCSSINASGAPSDPCRGASAGSRSDDRIVPKGSRRLYVRYPYTAPPTRRASGRSG